MTTAKRESAFTLIEIIIVIAIIAVVYALAFPNFKIRIDNDVADHIARLRSDIRSAWDLATLGRKNYRLVFELETGNYWLEATDAKSFRIDIEPMSADKTLRQEKDDAAQFDEDFAKYEEVAGEEFQDSSTGDKVKQTSPVILAKDSLKQPTWYKVTTPEWQNRNIGDFLVILDAQAQHHQHKISIEDQGKEALVKIYFSPGYCEKAYMHLYYRGGGEGGIDPVQPPYTLLTHPRGVAKVVSERLEVDVNGTWEEAEDA